ncbi:YolD-like family protein [Paenibacillus sp. J5C_2022]|uniref:YolD-like family protein n=1 Tax=Paenibacillus sp. J5C2022 TaxID=2977129 RepID=UPI0021D28A9D|nr:YolD-like family protein [Paenibacillus sp. J5C2022]MCU6709333.1 YolD-like family protein [Paenibacillus sp. J5C2022]
MLNQRKKLEGNGLWESSRMMLPEHIRALNEQRRELSAKKKPLLDGDAIEDIERAIAESFNEKVSISLHIYDKYEELRAVGVVERIDTYGRRVMIDGEWFRLNDVIGVG